MAIDAAFEIAREAGAENINARTVAKKLNCSPHSQSCTILQRVKKAAYAKADDYRTEYI